MRWFVVLLSFFFASMPAVAQDPKVNVELLSSRTTAAPGETFTVALRQDITPGWHTYWRNPGDSGEETKLHWQLPEGWTASDILWPAPTAHPIPPLVNYGYDGTLILPVRITVPENAVTGTPVVLKARATWLVCNDICIPESAEVIYTVNIEQDSITDDASASLLADAVAALPKKADAVLSLVLMRPKAELDVSALGLGALREAYFFPEDGALLDHAAPQVLRGNTLQLKTSDSLPVALPTTAAGLLRYVTESGNRGVVQVSSAVTVSAPSTGDAFAADTSGSVSIETALLFALLGGIILNLMPCVFPILSLKALSLVQKNANVKKARAEGVWFLAGVQASMLALAGLLLVLKAGGAAIGWGFQLQYLPFVMAMTLLFVALALNLLGFFEITGRFQNIGDELTRKHGGTGAFFTGALAVLVATPCTAPFMGAALGFAFTQPAAVTLLVFAALGLGLAAPFLLLCWVPALARRLPKPGVWMQRFREFLAFPMLAAAVWLFWVATLQGGADAAAWLLGLIVLLSFKVWLARVWPKAGIALLVLFILGAGYALFTVTPTRSVSSELSKGSWSSAAVDAALAEGRPVLVDFTAAWCITCLVNERTTLSDDAVKAALTEAGVVVLVADWTNQDALITVELAKYGRVGVPLYLLYRGVPGETPEVLPQILSPSLMLDKITTLGKPQAAH
ncbi:MAG: protein-disulfide reductase DsbD family protein [Holosporales bacterium]